MVIAFAGRSPSKSTPHPDVAQAHSDEAGIELAVYDGTTCIGYIIQQESRVVALSAARVSLGVFAHRKVAFRAVSTMARNGGAC